ncbi:MAG TPA: hypothetical protein PLA24_05535, partial [Tenuifilaceae bacterium]|nr:hypothetical protein [Tenuifilaceae bacterium]
DDDNISDCGGTTVANLPGNNPIVGTGLWTVVSGSGGSFIDPTVYNTQFSGTNGSTYTLRWTISNGTCTSSDDMTVSFPLLPVQPLEFTVSKTPVCQGETGVAYTVPLDPSVTYTWTYEGTGATINGTTNAVTVDFSTTATSGTFTLNVTATNGCGTSAPRSVSIVVNEAPTATIAIVGSSDICDGENPQMTVTFAGGTSPYSFSITDGTNTESFTNVTSPYGYTASNALVWTGPGTNNTFTYSIPTVTSANGCSNVGSNTLDFNVYKIPETGPEYHVPNNFAN